MNALVTLLATVSSGLTHRIRHGWEQRGSEHAASTLELVILVLGLITVATLLVAALTSAVKSRTDQIV